MGYDSELVTEAELSCPPHDNQGVSRIVDDNDSTALFHALSTEISGSDGHGYLDLAQDSSALVLLG